MQELQKTMSDQDIIDEFGVSKGFINRHSTAIGVYLQRPHRRFFRDDVEAFFRGRAAKTRRKISQRKETDNYIRNLIKMTDISFQRRMLKKQKAGRRDRG